MTNSVALQSRPKTRGAPVSRKAETVPRYLSLEQEERLRDWGYSDRIILGHGNDSGQKGPFALKPLGIKGSNSETISSHDQSSILFAYQLKSAKLLQNCLKELNLA
ncbi:hypothetical protein [Leptolyngbya sp. CCY15150]|uniref:hypothetical protein n=1 Tax=Leptolyngbya sp. CCY15150 TaxID=2767772 RepID=UPI0019512048|nr:hypothetical protein [Leptolyngbya sp. CCY15150]